MKFWFEKVGFIACQKLFEKSHFAKCFFVFLQEITSIFFFFLFFPGSFYFIGQEPIAKSRTIIYCLILVFCDQFF